MNPKIKVTKDGFVELKGQWDLKNFYNSNLEFSLHHHTDVIEPEEIITVTEWTERIKQKYPISKKNIEEIYLRTFAVD